MQCHSDFKKFIQIGGHDAQIPQSLQKRHVNASGPIKHPLIEGQKTLVSRQKLMVFRVTQIAFPIRLNLFKDGGDFKSIDSQSVSKSRLMETRIEFYPKGMGHEP